MEWVIFRIKNAFELLENNEFVSDLEDSDNLNTSNIYILPGVEFRCMRQLHKLNLIDKLIKFSNRGGNLIGICLGMQLLFEIGKEFEETKGLGIIELLIVFLKDHWKRKVILPHVGWNRIIPLKNNDFNWVEKIKFIISTLFIVMQQSSQKK